MNAPTHETPPLGAKRVALVVCGGVAAYKALDLVRALRADGARVQGLLTRNARRFITPLAFRALAGEPTLDALFEPQAADAMDHIAVARAADLIIVAPASADMLARMAQGRADDMACATLLAARTRPLIAPAMNPAMWEHPATQANVALLRARGARFVGPEAGDVACGEHGYGRLAETQAILAAARTALEESASLAGARALVTAGPTLEALDPVRYIANRSSGKQGYAIAEALAEAGCAVDLISGPAALDAPRGVRLERVESARDMLAACARAVAAEPACDLAVCAAAVADWRPAETAPSKRPKAAFAQKLALTPNPDVLAAVANATRRPRLVIGFAAETGDPRPAARAKLAAKGCDWIVANDVAGDVMGADANAVHLVRADGEEESWPRMAKTDVARELTRRIAAALAR